MTMPFSPCDPNAASCDDVSVSILNRIFGDAINQMATGADPDAIAASSSLFATLMETFNTGILTVAGIIVSYVALVGSVNTAEHGEAFGKHWSSVWTPLRIVTGGGGLLPSASGYSFIQKFVLLLALWSIGFANAIYQKGVEYGFVDGGISTISSEIGMGSSAKINENYPLYDLRKFASDYLAVAWCQKTVNANYAEGLADGTEIPDIAPVVQTDIIQEGANKTSTLTEYRDTNENSNLGGGKAICGTLKFYDYSLPSNMAVAPGIGSVFDPATVNSNKMAIAQLRIAALSAKIKAANQVMSDLTDWVAEWPTHLAVIDPSATQWNTVKADRFNQIVNSAQSTLITDLKNQIDNDPTLKNIMQKYVDDVTKDGWAMAGGFYQRLGGIREEMAKIYAEPVAEIGAPDLSSLPGDSLGQSVQMSYETAFNTIIAKSVSGASFEQNSMSIGQCIKSLFGSKFSPDSGVSVDSIGSRGHGCMSNFVGSIMQGAIDTLVGTDGHVDSLARIKTLGDSLKLAESILNSTVYFVRATTDTGEVAAAGLSTATAGIANGVPLVKAIRQTFEDMFGQPISLLAENLHYLAFWFGIFIPTLPYFIFMIAVIGWILSVVQAIVAAPLWAVMHMTPDRTFVGSQSQGYLLMFSLFARPGLIIIGLFTAFKAANPIIDYVAQFFFATREANVTSAESLGWVIEFLTMRDWLWMFGLVITPVVYMIFGLSQVLPDTVLSWIGAGIRSLGETQATSEMRGGMQRHTTVQTNAGSRASLPPPNTHNPKLTNNPGTSGNGGGGNASPTYGTGSRSRATGQSSSRRKASTNLVNANPQGVTPPTSGEGSFSAPAANHSVTAKPKNEIVSSGGEGVQSHLTGADPFYAKSHEPATGNTVFSEGGSGVADLETT